MDKRPRFFKPITHIDYRDPTDVIIKMLMNVEFTNPEKGAGKTT